MILEYLSSPSETTKSAAIEKLSEQPDESFEMLLNFTGPYPDNLHPHDVPDYISSLLTELLLKHPRLLTERDISRMSSGARYFVVAAAIASESPAFGPIILSALRDRVADKRFLVVRAIQRLKFLQTAEAERQLRRFLSMKSMEYCRDEIRQALAAFGDGREKDG